MGVEVLVLETVLRGVVGVALGPLGMVTITDANTMAVMVLLAFLGGTARAPKQTRGLVVVGWGLLVQYRQVEVV